MVENGTIPVLILAGGLGTRLWPITDLYQKALVPVAGKPCVRWIIEELQNQNFRNITLCINEGVEREFINAIGDGEIKYSAAPSTTTICKRILQNANSLRGHKFFAVIYGDDLTRTDYEALIEKIDSTQADVALAVTSSVPLEFGLIQTDVHGVVREFVEKPKLSQFTASSIWTGRAILRTSLLSKFIGKADLAKDVFPSLLWRNYRIIAHNGNQPWFDVGSIAHWRRANEAYAREPAEVWASG